MLKMGQEDAKKEEGTTTLPARPCVEPRIKGDYDALVSRFTSLVALSSEKKRSRELVSVMKDLAYFHPEPRLAPSFIALLQYDDRKVLSLAHYFLRLLALDLRVNPPPKDEMSLEFLNRDMAGGNLERRVWALRTFALLCPDAEKSKVVDVVCRQLAGDASEKKGRKKSSRISLFERSGTSERENTSIQRVAFAACLHRDLFPPRLLGPALEVICSSDPVAARHGFALLDRFSLESPEVVATQLRPHLPHLAAAAAMAGTVTVSIGSSPRRVSQKSETKDRSLNLVDIQARVLLARICSNIIGGVGIERDVRESFLATLWQLTQDPHNRVFFATVFGLSRLQWHVVSRAVISPHPRFLRQDSSGSGSLTNVVRRLSLGSGVKDSPTAPPRVQLLPGLLKRFESILHLGDQYRPVLHQACRTVAALAHSWVKTSLMKADEAVGKIEEDSSVASPSDLPKGPQRGVSLMDIKRRESLIDVFDDETEPKEEELVTPALKNDLNSTVPKSPFVTLIDPLLALAKGLPVTACPDLRIQALRALLWAGQWESEEQVESLRRVFNDILSDEFPHSAARRLLGGLFRDLQSRLKAYNTLRFARLACDLAARWVFSPNSDQELIQVIWRVAMRGGEPARRAAVLEILFHVLDHQLSEDESTDPDRLTQRVVVRRGVFWFLGEYGNHLCNERAERYTAKGKATTQLDPQNASYELTLMAGVGGDATAPYLAHTQNPAMKAVVLRLEQAAGLATWETRAVCLNALAKLAFRSGDPLRLHVFEFIVALTQEVGVPRSIMMAARPLLAILDGIYAARARFLSAVSVFSESAPSADDLGLSREQTTAVGPDDLSDAQLKGIYADHRRLLEEISVFCHLPRNFTPLGLDSKPYIAAAWARVANERKLPTLHRQVSWDNRLLAHRISAPATPTARPEVKARRDLGVSLLSVQEPEEGEEGKETEETVGENVTETAVGDQSVSDVALGEEDEDSGGGREEEEERSTQEGGGHPVETTKVPRLPLAPGLATRAIVRQTADTNADDEEAEGKVEVPSKQKEEEPKSEGVASLPQPFSEKSDGQSLFDFADFAALSDSPAKEETINETKGTHKDPFGL